MAPWLKALCFSIALDGMDQAKFKVPRNTCNSKDLEPLWRPVLHMTGLIVEGIGEFYQIAESDCKKEFGHEHSMPQSYIR